MQHSRPKPVARANKLVEPRFIGADVVKPKGEALRTLGNGQLDLESREAAAENA